MADVVEELKSSNGDVIQITWTLEEHTSQPSGNKTWILKEKICNKSKKKINGRVTENPWQKEKLQAKVYAKYDKDGKEEIGGDEEQAKKNGQDITIEPDKCDTKTFVFDKKPVTCYTDVYLYGEDGKLEKYFTWGTTNKLVPVIISSLPPKQERNLCVAMMLPFPMCLDKTINTSIWATIESIEVPYPLVLVSCYPGVEVPFKIQHAQRGNMGSLIIKQVAPVEEGSCFKIRATIAYHLPHETKPILKRTTAFYIVNDTQPPSLKNLKKTFLTDHMHIEATLHDSCSGVSSATLMVRSGEYTFSIEPIFLKGIEQGISIAEFVLPAPLAEKNISMRIITEDAAGNKILLNDL